MINNIISTKSSKAEIFSLFYEKPDSNYSWILGEKKVSQNDRSQRQCVILTQSYGHKKYTGKGPLETAEFLPLVPQLA